MAFRSWTKNFKLLWLGTLVSTGGDHLSQIALGVIALQKTQSVTVFALTLAINFVPQLVGSFFAGPMVDRSNPIKILVASDIFRGLILGLYCLWELVAGTPLMALYLLSFFQGLANAWFIPASRGTLLHCVPRENLMQATSTLQITVQVSEIIFKSLGGVLVSIVRPIWLLTADAISFFLSGVSESAIKANAEALEQQRVDNASESLSASLRQGFVYVRLSPAVLYLLVAIGFVNFFALPGFVLLLPLFKRTADLGLSYYGIALGLMTLGGITGGLMISYFRPKRARFTIFATAILAFSISWIFLSLAVSPAVMLGFLLIAGGSQAIVGVLLEGTLLESVDRRFIGRVKSIQLILTSFLVPVGIILFGLLGDHFEIRSVILNGYIVCLIVSFLIFAQPIARRAFSVEVARG